MYTRINSIPAYAVSRLLTKGFLWKLFLEFDEQPKISTYNRLYWPPLWINNKHSQKSLQKWRLKNEGSFFSWKFILNEITHRLLVHQSMIFLLFLLILFCVSCGSLVDSTVQSIKRNGKTPKIWISQVFLSFHFQSLFCFHFKKKNISAFNFKL